MAFTDEPDDKCAWAIEDNDQGTWESGCHVEWYLVEGGPVDNGMLFCPFCGKDLVEEGHHG